MSRTFRRLSAALLLALSAALLAASAATTAATNSVVLGSPAFPGTGGEGWGTTRPAKLYNGGDPSGLVKEIAWTSWAERRRPATASDTSSSRTAATTNGRSWSSCAHRLSDIAALKPPTPNSLSAPRRSQKQHSARGTSGRKPRPSASSGSSAGRIPVAESHSREQGLVIARNRCGSAPPEAAPGRRSSCTQ